MCDSNANRDPEFWWFNVKVQQKFGSLVVELQELVEGGDVGSYLLGEALLGLDLVMLLHLHSASAGGRWRQFLHLLNGLHGDALRKHSEEGGHVHDDALLVRARHRHVCNVQTRDSQDCDSHGRVVPLQHSISRLVVHQSAILSSFVHHS